MNKSPFRPILPNLNFPVCLAPMVGLSHVGLRLMLRQYLPKNAITIWPTEMLNSRRLPNEDFAKTPETYRSECEDHLVPQILGNEEVPIKKSVEKLKDWGAVGIDINMGCPVQKALKHNYGVALMGDQDYAARVVEITKKSTDLPVSVKLRAGQKEKESDFIGFVKKLESAGADWITLHPRFAHEMRRGEADWNKIKRLREELKIPVIGNGDVQTAEDFFALREQTNCDMVMVGRALTARPWLLWQIGENLGFAPPEGKTDKAPRTSLEEGAEYANAFLYFVDVMEQYFSKDLGVRKIKFYCRTSSVWLEFGHELNAMVSSQSDFQGIRDVIFKFFSQPQRMMQKTNLRI